MRNFWPREWKREIWEEICPREVLCEVRRSEEEEVLLYSSVGGVFVAS